MPLASWLVSLAAPIATKVLLALGIGTLTYVGLDTAYNAAQGLVIQYYGQMGASSMAIVDLAGVGQAIGIILGAMAARLSLIMVGRLSKLV